MGRYEWPPLSFFRESERHMEDHITLAEEWNKMVHVRSQGSNLVNAGRWGSSIRRE